MKQIKPIVNRLAAFTLIELLVVITIIAILVSLALPAITGALAKGKIIQTTSNYRQLYVLTTSAALDQTTAGSTNPVWLGDDGGSATRWKAALTNGNTYCSSSTFNKLISVKGSPANTVIQPVSSQMGENDVFLNTANISASGIADVPPYYLKGAALITVGGAAYAVIGTNYSTNTYNFGTN